MIPRQAPSHGTAPFRSPSRREDGARAFPPEALFELEPTDHIDLPVRKDNLQIAVVTFMVMMVLALLTVFLGEREHRDAPGPTTPGSRILGPSAG
ncbi:MAG TPA: hypothetical protein VH062_16130 [Polyangiaceae bacterium]|jgi:hypothetical protein|nr:hypothetical protein [Polyangiaceae bacterium]